MSAVVVEGSSSHTRALAVRTTSLRSWFLRPRSATLFALFRIAFFSGLLIHFAPALLHLEESFGPSAVRLPFLSKTLFHFLPHLPFWLLQTCALLTLAACASAGIGFFPRTSAALCFLGTYSFASFNALPFFTLALANAWAVLPVFCICEGSAAALSVEAWWRRRQGHPPSAPPSVLANLIVFQLLLVFFFAGIEKVLAGWPMNNEMAMLLQTPKGYLLRDWAADLAWLERREVGLLLSWATVLLELLVPLGLLVRRTRLFALFSYELFFVGVMCAMEVPPLFFALFACGMPLILDEKDLARIGASLRRRADQTAGHGAKMPSP